MNSDFDLDFQYFVPSFYGDVSITAMPDDKCRVDYEKLTPQEIVALRALRDRAAKKGWAEAAAFEEIPADDGGAYRGSGRLVSVALKAPIDDVRKVLVRAMKPGRSILSVVRFAGGAIEELVDTKEAVKKAKEEKKPAKAADVAAPTIGCPAPDFANAEVRATRVLRAFLEPGQLEDYERTQSFVARGADSGHVYMLTSRQARDRLAKYERSLYDLDEKRPVCVHSWEIPASEELLTLLAFISVPGGEKYVRYLPDETVVMPLVEPGDYIRACRIPADVA